MSSEDHILLNGVISEVLGDSRFRVLLDEGGEILATLSGKIRKNKIRIIMNDKVQVAVSTYDNSRGIIKFRSK